MTSGWEGKPEAPVSKPERLALVLILALAAGLRLRQIDFGLPALNDPDEPVFIMTALDMLREGRLNPGWFGHPATLLFYLLALVMVAVALGGAALGRWASADTLVAAVFSDPAIIVLPLRMAMAACGVASVWMTWRIGRRAADPATGLGAALLITVNALHVDLSQVIRTDMLATLLMGWAALHALAIARSGRSHDHVLAGVAAGLACATKWPALLVLVAPVTAGLWHVRHGRGAARLLAIAPAVAVATLLAASPYLLLDWPTVVRDLGGEARPIHPGATGHGLFGNLYWYARHPVFDSFGLAGTVLLAIGIVSASRLRSGKLVLLPTLVLIWVALAAQSLVWARWMVPLLPLMAVLIAIGLGSTLRLIRDHRSRKMAFVVTVAAIAGAMAHTTWKWQDERANDPRQAATAWVRRHVPSGRTILVEHAAFDLLVYRGRLLFPLGSAGCVDVRAMLTTAPTHRKVNDLRRGRAVVDLGHVDPGLLRSCEADYLILSNFARYRAEAGRFRAALSNYRMLVRDYELVTSISSPGTHGNGATIDIFRRRLS